MSGKPVHAGHWGLIQIASNENDEVHLFVSSSDRKRPGEMTITGAAMMQIWNQFLEPALPSNVDVIYGGSPVRRVYEDLEAAEAVDSMDTFQIYSDNEDILKYTDASLGKSAPTLLASGQIIRRGVDRNETVNVSGTKMRELLLKGMTAQFAKFLPTPVQGNAQEIIDILQDIKESTVRVTSFRRLIKEYTQHVLFEANLSPMHMHGDRYALFLKKMKRREPFELVDGNQVIIPMSDAPGNKALVAALESEDRQAYGKAFELGVVDSYGNRIRPTKIQKTAEFGGKSSEVSLAAETGQISEIQNAIQQAGNGRPINIVLGSKLIKNVTGIEKVPGTPKADAVLMTSGADKGYLSLKASDKPGQMQQWGGVTKLTDDPEVKKFVKDVSDIIEKSDAEILPFPVYRDIRPKLQTAIVYGDRSSPQNSVDAVIATRGRISLKETSKNTFEFSISSGEIHYYPELPADNWQPVLFARPGVSRSDLGIPNTRLGVFPRGYRASSSKPIETLMSDEDEDRVTSMKKLPR